MTMQTESLEQIDELPEDVAAAWATVLLDLWEKHRSQAHHDAEQTPEAESVTVKEGDSNGE